MDWFKLKWKLIKCVLCNAITINLVYNVEREHNLMKEITAQEMRDIIATLIQPTIQYFRASKASIEGRDFDSTEFDEITDEEIDDFIASNPLFDNDLKEQLSDPGFLGFFSKTANVNEEWLDEFKGNIKDWSSNNSWVGADLPWLDYNPNNSSPDSEIWYSGQIIKPLWLGSTPSYLILANKLLKDGRLLNELEWREFEKIIAFLLEREGWSVKLTKETRDGGIDVIASRIDNTIGEILSIWQAKKYSLKNKVKLKEVRELSAIKSDMKASKGIIVTTSHLTKDAVEWVKRDLYQLSYKEKEHVEKWIKSYFK